MFLHVLNEDQKRLFVLASRRLCRLDEVAASGELRYLEASMREMGAVDVPDESEPDDPVALDAAVFNTPLSKRVLLLELCGLAASDGIVSNDETAFLARIADSLSVDRSQVTRMVDFSLRRRNLVEEGRALVLSER